MPSSHDTHFQRALNRILRKSIAGPGEMAREIGCTAQHIRAVARGDCHLSPQKREELSSWLCDERDVSIQVDGMLGSPTPRIDARRGTTRMTASWRR